MEMADTGESTQTPRDAIEQPPARGAGQVDSFNASRNGRQDPDVQPGFKVIWPASDGTTIAEERWYPDGHAELDRRHSHCDHIFEDIVFLNDGSMPQFVDKVEVHAERSTLTVRVTPIWEAVLQFETPTDGVNHPSPRVQWHELAVLIKGCPEGCPPTKCKDHLTIVKSMKDSDGSGHHFQQENQTERFRNSPSAAPRTVSVVLDKADAGIRGATNGPLAEGAATLDGFDVIVMCSYLVDVHSRDIFAEADGHAIGEPFRYQNVHCLMFPVGRPEDIGYRANSLREDYDCKDFLYTYCNCLTQSRVPIFGWEGDDVVGRYHPSRQVLTESVPA